MRLSLRYLCGGHRQRRGEAAQSLRARRQGNRADAEGAGRGAGRLQPRGRRPRRVPAPAAAAAAGMRGTRATPGAGDLPLAPPAERGRARRRRRTTSSSISPRSGVSYEPGDAFGMFPRTNPAAGQGHRRLLGIPLNEPISAEGQTRCRDGLTDGRCARRRRRTRCSQLLACWSAAPAREGQGAGRRR